ncbi:biopolymer transporter ExbD [Halomonas saccharevitans]|uniref:Biopolymer transporter ExbD n=1 Tax=Halomonas saccharevitans TaxID=416872 RepID=A0ABU3NIJ1_9GAMM|nr:biopolymer transporter ExbD [Halomonas saccharevitans]MDT8880425.1 biopolymer transporter ExbD [Halomonas saccharevitans]
MRFSRRRRDPVEVNLTPLIDVVFLLLIFFMVSTTFETRQALELELPESASGQPMEAGPVILVVTASGEYRLDDRTYSAGTLSDALAAQAEQAREHGLVVEADGRAAHADVVRVLDRAAGLEIRHVRIATEAVAKPQAETP